MKKKFSKLLIVMLITVFADDNNNDSNNFESIDRININSELRNKSNE